MDPRELGLWDDGPAPIPEPEKEPNFAGWDPASADSRTVVVVRFDALNPQGVLEYAFEADPGKGISALAAAKAYRRALEEVARKPGSFFGAAGAVFKTYQIIEEE